MTHAWVAEKLHNGLAAYVTLHRTAEGARRALETLLATIHPGYRETCMTGRYDEGECEFIMPDSFETVGLVRKYVVGD